VTQSVGVWGESVVWFDIQVSYQICVEEVVLGPLLTTIPIGSADVSAEDSNDGNCAWLVKLE
jgi:hypothetical protein